MLPLIAVLVIWNFCKAENETYLSRHDTGMRSDAEKFPEPCIMESLTAIRSQATATNIYLEEIRNILHSYKERLDVVEDRLEDIEKRIEANMKKTDDVSEQVGIITNVEAAIEDVKAVIEANGEITATIKARQMTMLSEVRLISLYKMSNQTSVYTDGGGGHGSELAVDGQFVYSHWAPSTPDRTISHTLLEAGSKLWIDLGALFRIYRVTIWNARHCDACDERFIGTHIYADERLLGAATSAKLIYEYNVAENDPIYAKSVILHQTHTQYLHVTEVQVWGTGPFPEDDRFA